MINNVIISVPITKEQERFIKERVKNGTAANKAHAVRQSIDNLAREEAQASLRRAREDVRSGRLYYGDLDKLTKKIK